MTDPNQRIYLDNAATSFPKPPAVVEAVARYMTDPGAAPGRGAYAESRQAAKILARTRASLCRLIGGGSPEHLVFTLNTTDALNLAIKGMIAREQRTNPGAPVHFVTTAMDHNSILRPFNALARTPGVDWTCVPVDPQTGLVDPGEFAAALRPNTLLAATLHASNVSGTVQPIAELGERAHAAGVPFLVDAAQSLGHIAVDVDAMHIDLLAFPGHKGLLGPLGTGGLWIRPGLEDRLDPLRDGGTGSRSDLDTQPETLPDKFEPGSHNMPGIAGLGAGVDWILERGLDAIRAHEERLMARFLVGIEPLEREGLLLLGPRDLDRRVGVFSVFSPHLRSLDAAAMLESEFGILGRAGIHCAPRAHGAFGTLEREGAMRLSVSPFTTDADIDRAIEALLAVYAAPAKV
ncbi:MAG: aminotransferase class V-fold PLP-dependent enzyme [Phycisphaerales bacterium JB037]